MQRLATAGASVRGALSAAAAIARDWVPDALLMAGASGIAYGAWLIYAPVGFIVGGALLMLAGWLGARSAA